MNDEPGPIPPAPERAISGNALKKIGQKLARGDDLTEDDEERVAEFRSHAEELRSYMLDVVDGILDAALLPVSVTVSARAKSWTTILAKIEGGSSLERIRDVVGVRVIMHGRADRDDQDLIVRTLARHFKVKSTIDRRINPIAGYRAVHLEVSVGRSPCEIQIRTPLQQAWAEVSEAIADKWGRELRYGKEPSNLTDGQRSTWDEVQRASDVVDRFEKITLMVNQIGFRDLARHPYQRLRTLTMHHRSGREIRRVLESVKEEYKAL